VNYFRSPKFIQADGGWNRVVWMPSNLKEKIKEDIPQDIVDKIPTEKEVNDLDSLRDFLEKHNHPVVERWVKEEKEKKVEPADITPHPEKIPTPPPMPMQYSNGIKVILKNAKITIDRVVLKGKG